MNKKRPMNKFRQLKIKNDKKKRLITILLIATIAMLIGTVTTIFLTKDHIRAGYRDYQSSNVNQGEIILLDENHKVNFKDLKLVVGNKKYSFKENKNETIKVQLQNKYDTRLKQLVTDFKPTLDIKNTKNRQIGNLFETNLVNRDIEVAKLSLLDLTNKEEISIHYTIPVKFDNVTIYFTVEELILITTSLDPYLTLQLEYNNLETQLDELTNLIEDLELDLAEGETINQTLLVDLTNLQLDIADKLEEIVTLENSLNLADLEILNLSDLVTNLQDRVTSLEEQIFEDSGLIIENNMPLDYYVNYDQMYMMVHEGIKVYNSEEIDVTEEYNIEYTTRWTSNDTNYIYILIIDQYSGELVTHLTHKFEETYYPFQQYYYPFVLNIEHVDTFLFPITVRGEVITPTFIEYEGEPIVGEELYFFMEYETGWGRGTQVMIGDGATYDELDHFKFDSHEYLDFDEEGFITNVLINGEQVIGEHLYIENIGEFTNIDQYYFPINGHEKIFKFVTLDQWDGAVGFDFIYNETGLERFSTKSKYEDNHDVYTYSHGNKTETDIEIIYEIHLVSLYQNLDPIVLTMTIIK